MGIFARSLPAIALSVLGILLTASVAALADKRVALIVGMSAYKFVGPLDNPGNDARLVAETLRALGFTLIGDGPQLDLDKPALEAAVQNFSREMQGADVALFYYSGHGVQVRGENYLIPVSANPVREADIDFHLMDANVVLRQMEHAGTKLNVVILDACRNNPFGGRGFRAVSRGLARMVAPEGTVISYATQPGNVALDGNDGNSPYTKALAQMMRRPGLDVFQTFNAVGLAVMQSTGNSQQPWLAASPIKGAFFFSGEPPSAQVPNTNATPQPQATTPSRVEVAQFCQSVSTNTSLAVVQRLAQAYKGTTMGDCAEDRLEELKKSQVAVVAPPTPPATPPTQVQPTVGVFPPASGTQSLSAAQERALKPKDVFKECDGCPEMVVVPSGSFTMGSPADEKDRRDNEGPQHRVTIGKAFAVGKFEVTVDQFAAFVKDTGHDTGSKCYTFEDGKYEERSGRSWRNPGYTQAGLHPVACINWNDAKAYVAWLSRKSGKNYRLLTEAEWEYTARSGTSSRYSFGDSESGLCSNGNGADQTAKRQVPGTSSWTFAPCDDGYAYTAPVGSFAANGFGLHDMHGNVWEWTEDCYKDSYTGAPTDGSASTSGDCSNRVLRGGSWISGPQGLRSALRDWYTSDLRDYSVGFRLGRTITP